MLSGHCTVETQQGEVNHAMDGYTNFYEFSENPFETTPNPRFFLLSENNREALASLTYGITERKGFIVISGVAGIGKTSLIQYLLNNLDKKVKGVIIDQTGIGIEKLLIEVFIRLGLSPRYENKASLVHQLNAYLIQQLSCDENLAIFIDEAQNLSKETMEELRLLSNLETSNSKLLQIILVGQPEIDDKLDSKELRQFKQRIVLRSTIGCLTEEESRRYIDYRLRLAGSSSSKVFTPEAVSLICRYSRGIPLSINIQCNKAFGIGYRLSRKRIDPSIVKKVNKSFSKKISYSALALVCLMVIIILLGREHIKSISEKRASQASVQRSMGVEKIPILPPESNDLTSQNSLNLALNDKPTVSLPQPKAEKPIEKFVKVKEGDTLSSLSKKYYNQVNITLIDRILMSNPEITNPNLIKTNQTIRIPDITEDSLIIEFPDRTFKVHLGTFLQAETAKQYRDEAGLKGKEIEIISRKPSPQETWYMAVAGKFDSREECLKAIRILRSKGLLPAFIQK